MTFVEKLLLVIAYGKEQHESSAGEILDEVSTEDFEKMSALVRGITAEAADKHHAQVIGKLKW